MGEASSNGDSRVPGCRSVFLVLPALCGILACFAGRGTEEPRVPGTFHLGARMTLNTSYYGDDDGFAGKKTASGEIFNPRAFTCAHRSLPFGTVLAITNPANGKTVSVRVNDRGPFVRRRDLDISVAAASALGLIRSGVLPLLVEIRSLGQP